MSGTGARSEPTAIGFLRAALGVALLALTPLLASAATITVDLGDSTVDPNDGRCSLREAITAANTDSPSGAAPGECPAGAGADTIRLTGDVSLSVADNSGTFYAGGDTGLPVITTDVIVDGGGFAVERADGAPPFRIFTLYGADYYLSADPTLTLADVTVHNGSATQQAGCEENCGRGGGILQYRGTLRVERVTLSGNAAEFGGGGIAMASAFQYGDKPSLTVIESLATGNSSAISAANGDLVITDSVVSNNGAGISSCGQSSSACPGPAGRVSISTSEISGNAASGMSVYGGTAELERVTISGNGAGGLVNSYGSVTITNSTISDNHGNSGGAITQYSYGNVTLINSTVFGNSGNFGSISTGSLGPGNFVKLTRTLVGNSLSGVNCTGQIVDGGSSFADDTTCGTLPNTLGGVDPVLADNGGPTKTHALLPGSSAINAGGGCGLPVDQRGVARDDGFCDSGAFEFHGCGDGVVEAPEACDDGGGNSDTEPDACRSDCTPAACGDGVVDSGDECDDGNGVPNDGCEPDCSLTCRDADGDGFGAPGSAWCAASGAEDCDDSDATTHPGGAQLCDGINNDCDDPSWPVAPSVESDADGDGFRICDNDCDDAAALVHPAAGESCNAIDDNCDGQVDEDALGEDFDADGVHGLCDNCPEVHNPAQGDLDGDTVGDACDNCALDPNPWQSDRDQDSEGDQCDLDDGMIYVATSDPDFVQWQSESGFESWNVYRGDLEVLRSTMIYTQSPGSTPLQDRRCQLTEQSDEDPIVPEEGKVAFYLVTGVAGGVEGDLGADSAGATRLNPNPCP